MRNDKGRPTALQTAIVRYVPVGKSAEKPATDLEVDLIGAIHIVIPVVNQRCAAFWGCPVTMRDTPNMTYFSPGAATTAWWNASGTPEASGASSTLGAGDQGATVVNASTANDAVTEEVAIHATAESEL